MRVLDRRTALASLRAARARRIGRVSRLVGLSLEVEGVDAAIGDVIVVRTADASLEAQVVAVHGEALACMPYGEPRGVRFGAEAEGLGTAPSVPAGTGLLGRVLDGLGRPLDGRPLPAGLDVVPLDATTLPALARRTIDEPLGLGVKSLDTMVPCGKGQRLGVFAGSGVGKSSLMSMIARGAQAPVVVLALIGERGREVNEFLHNDLGEAGLARSVVVVSTSDEPALVRIRAAFTATRVAEWFRDQGADVVLMMDSLTRFAMAQREVGLSVGEPPATKGYPPSVFSNLAKLVERAGLAPNGSITGLYTVLVEGDDMNEPVADAVRSLLDGHVVLSRHLATAGHFPSVDVLESISRLERAVVSPERRALSAELRRLMAAYREARDLIEVGAYAPGTNPAVDRAVRLWSGIDAFLQQDITEVVDAATAWSELGELLGAEQP